MRIFVRSFILSLTITSIWLSGISCTKSATDPDTGGAGGASEWQCGSYNGHTLYTGPKGGRYYYNSSGNKTYVDKSHCNC